MELHQLRYFIAVAEEGSFSRAAARCSVAQPTLSQQIKKLERELGVRLLDRLPRQVIPTEAGLALLRRARRVVSEIRQAREEIRTEEFLSTGKLVVGVIPAVGPLLLPRIVCQYMQDAPGVAIELREAPGRNLVAQVIAGEVDLALVALLVEDDRLVVECLGSEPFMVALPTDHALTQAERLDLEAVARERLVLLNEHDEVGEAVRGWYRQASVSPDIGFQGIQMATLRGLVACGFGVSVLPAQLQAEEIGNGHGLVYRPLEDKRLRWTLGVIRHRDRSVMSACEQFLATVRREVNALGLKLQAVSG